MDEPAERLPTHPSPVAQVWPFLSLLFLLLFFFFSSFLLGVLGVLGEMIPDARTVELP